MLNQLTVANSTKTYRENEVSSEIRKDYIVAVITKGSTEMPLFFKPTYAEKILTRSTSKAIHSIEKELKQWTLDLFNKEETEAIDPANFINKEAKSHLNQIYSYDKSSDSKALSYMFNLIEEAFSKHDLLLVDALLSNIDLVRTRKIVFIGLLRGTYRARSKLKSWNSCALQISKFLDSNGENTKRLLRGLNQLNDSFTLTSTTMS